MISKFLTFLLLQIIFPYGRGENEFLIFPQLPAENINFNDLDGEGLRIILSGPLETGNVTLVGWENVYNSDGSLQQINTIEVTILYQGAPDNYSYSFGYNSEAVVLDFSNIKDNLYNETGTLLSGSAREFRNDYNNDLLFVLNQNQDIYFWQENQILRGFRNIRAKSKEGVKAFVKWLDERTNVPVSILTWNASNAFDKENSVVVPYLLSSVTSHRNGTTEIFNTAIAGLSEVYLNKEDDIFESLSIYMQEKIPAYRWHVAEQYTDLAFDTEIHIDLNYKNVHLWEDQRVLSLHGVKK